MRINFKLINVQGVKCLLDAAVIIVVKTIITIILYPFLIVTKKSNNIQFIVVMKKSDNIPVIIVMMKSDKNSFFCLYILFSNFLFHHVRPYACKQISLVVSETINSSIVKGLVL